MRLGFMTSVCPQQTLPQLLETARRLEYQGIEFRVEWNHLHGVELTAPPGTAAEARRQLGEAGLAATCVATSVKFNSANPEDHLPHREDLRRYIELAAELGAPYIRTFSDGVPEEDEAAREQVLSLAAESYAAVDDWAVQHGIEVLVETHTNMRAHWARKILDLSGAENLHVLWHIGHHLRRGQSVDEAYPHIRGRVRHLHFGAQEGSEFVTDADNQRTFELLSADGFTGFFSVEVINPDDPEAVLKLHAQKYREFMTAVQT